MFDCGQVLVGCLVGWEVGWMVSWLVGWSVVYSLSDPLIRTEDGQGPARGTSWRLLCSKSDTDRELSSTQRTTILPTRSPPFQNRLNLKLTSCNQKPGKSALCMKEGGEGQQPVFDSDLAFTIQFAFCPRLDPDSILSLNMR